MLRRCIRPMLASALLALSAAAAASAAPELRAVALRTESSAVEVTLEVSRATHYRLLRLSSPSRVVVDLDAHAAPHLHLPAASGLVERVRAGPRGHDQLRLVLQLNASAPASLHWMTRQGKSGAQLIVWLGSHPPAALGDPRAIAVAAAPSAPTPAAAVASVTAQAQALENSPAPPPEAVRAAHAPQALERSVIIAVDAGHGGVDPGATGHNGTHEKDVTLAIARDLAARIDAEPGMRALLTRDHDEFLLLTERVRRARAAKADLFVSVHADSIRDPGVSGSSVYVLSEHGASSEAARVLADRENAADLLGGISLADKDSTLASVLLDLSQSANISASSVAAEDVLEALQRVGEVRKARVQQAGFVVLKSPAIPSLLIETAYISNPGEERRLGNAAHQVALAQAIFAGLHAYFAHHPPPGTRLAQARASDAAELAGPATAAAAP